MLNLRRRDGTSVCAAPGLFILLIAYAVLFDFGSCAANEADHVVDVSDSNLTAYYPEVKPADGKWHKVDPTKPLSRPIKVRVDDGFFNITFVASPDERRSSVTLIDGFNKGCQFNMTVDKLKGDDSYYWTLMQKDSYVFGNTIFFEKSGTLGIAFPVAKDDDTENKIQYWSGDSKNEKKDATVKCVMSTKNAMDDTLHSELKIASIDLSTKPPPNEDKEFASVPLEVKWEMPIVRFASEEPISGAPGFLNIEITVAATVLMQMMLSALRD